MFPDQVGFRVLLGATWFNSKRPMAHCVLLTLGFPREMDTGGRSLYFSQAPIKLSVEVRQGPWM